MPNFLVWKLSNCVSSVLTLLLWFFQKCVVVVAIVANYTTFDTFPQCQLEFSKFASENAIFCSASSITAWIYTSVCGHDSHTRNVHSFALTHTHTQPAASNVQKGNKNVIFHNRHKEQRRTTKGGVLPLMARWWQQRRRQHWPPPPPPPPH